MRMENKPTLIKKIIRFFCTQKIKNRINDKWLYVGDDLSCFDQFKLSFLSLEERLKLVKNKGFFVLDYQKHSDINTGPIKCHDGRQIKKKERNYENINPNDFRINQEKVLEICDNINSPTLNKVRKIIEKKSIN